MVILLIIINAVILKKAHDVTGRDISGDHQVGHHLSYLPKPIVIEAVDEKGKPVPDIPVYLEVKGEPFDNLITGKKTKIVPAVCKTDERGYALFRVYTGEATGEYFLEAWSPQAKNKLSFSFIVLHKLWKLLSFLALLGGLAIFMNGLNFGSKSLTKFAGGKIREILWKMTKTPLLGVISGIGITMLTQSSSATSVMLVSFAHAGLLKLFQSLGVLLGADIATTITVQIIAFKIFNYALGILAIGFFLMTFSKRRNLHYLGRVIFAFGMIFFGISLMSSSLSPLRYHPNIRKILCDFCKNSFVGLLIGLILTAIVRSSATTIAMLLSFAFQGLIDINSAIPIIFGANIGTCINAINAAIGKSSEAKRVALAHFLFKIIFVAIVFPFLPQFTKLVSLTAKSVPRQIANAHTIFNIMAAIFFLPILRYYEKLIKGLIKEKEERVKPVYLDEAIVSSSPPSAIALAMREVHRMCDIVNFMMQKTIDVFKNNDENLLKEILKKDDDVDILEIEIRKYLTKVSQEEISEELSKRGVTLLYAVDELEHIGDIISDSLMHYAKKKIDLGLVFSKEGFKEIEEFHKFCTQSVKMATEVLTSFDKTLAENLAKRREEGNKLLKELHNKHLQRLRRGLKESLETSRLHMDLISDLERINFHASQIGTNVLEEVYHG